MTFSPLGLELLGGDPPEDTTNLSAGHATASASLTVAYVFAAESDGIAVVSGDLTVTAPTSTPVAVAGTSNGHAGVSVVASLQRTFAGAAHGVATAALIPQPVFLAASLIARAVVHGSLTVNTSSPGTKNPLNLTPFEPVYDLGGVTPTARDRPLLFT